MEHPYFDSMRPAVVVQHVKSRKQSPIFEKHRALSSTHRGHTKYSAKENCNPHTVYGKFRNNAEYSSMIRSTSKGRKNLDEAKFHAKQFKASLTNSTNQLSSTMHSFNFDGKKNRSTKQKRTHTNPRPTTSPTTQKTSQSPPQTTSTAPPAAQQRIPTTTNPTATPLSNATTQKPATTPT